MRGGEVPSDLTRLWDSYPSLAWGSSLPGLAQKQDGGEGVTIGGRVVCVSIDITLSLYFRTV